ncbi:stage II sporulation protein P [Shouchella shacheensis]|uniref:stage II sporulation protein P n=1 Tax=Shouchella shacheensis TaxID=1649580 RepID=UPI0007404E72|nr:stage II sporulation protein P [Shouchella shacheensis]
MPPSKQKTSLLRIASTLVIAMMTLFLCTSVLVVGGPGRGLTSGTIHNWTMDIEGEHFLRLMSMENRLFEQALPAEAKPFSLSALVFESATSISLDDPRSLLGRELPGFSVFDSTIHIAGEGTDYTNLSIESPPPKDVMMAEREAKQESLAKREELDRAAEEATDVPDEKIVYIGTAHTYESFLPELEATDPDEAMHPEVNITMTGEKLKQELDQRGFGAHMEQRDAQAVLQERGLGYGASYDVAREFVQSAMKENEDLTFFFDLHRDSLPREETTVDINGVSYARTMFVVGTDHPEYEKNLKLAEDLHTIMEEQYPGLNRAVITKGGAGTNGKFNQDLSPNSALIEIGGVDNTLEETYATTEAIADVFAEYYETNGGGE